MSLTTYTAQNVNSLKSLNKAINTVFGGVAARNEQIQQLLILSVNEAGKTSGGQVTNNLSWLSRMIEVAENTKGVNAKRITRYIVNVLCNETVSYNTETKQLAKKKDKEVKLSYTLEPTESWYDYEKAKDSSKAAFDYGKKRVTNVVTAALDTEKGGLTVTEVVQAMLDSKSLSLNELLKAMDSVNLVNLVEG